MVIHVLPLKVLPVGGAISCTLHQVLLLDVVDAYTGRGVGWTPIGRGQGGVNVQGRAWGGVDGYRVGEGEGEMWGDVWVLGYLRVNFGIWGDVWVLGHLRVNFGSTLGRPPPELPLLFATHYAPEYQRLSFTAHPPLSPPSSPSLITHPTSLTAHCLPAAEAASRSS